MIGDGGFASVWRARTAGPGGFERSVAIKVMRPARAKQKRFQDMLLDEARLVARIEHPNVAQIWEVGEDPRSIYVVMELVDGAPLDALRDRAEELGRPLPLGAVFRVLADVCGGLHAAHELAGEDGASVGLVHRDVSPQNILVSRHGVAKLIDFGIAKARERLGADTKTGFIKGKVSFMAPEQARAEEVDRRADVWAVGAVAYDLLAGRPPVEAGSDLARLAVLAGPDPIAPLEDSVPEPLRAVVARALEKDRDARFPTALAMKQAIEAALVESEHETTTDETGRFLEPFFPPSEPPRSASSSVASVPPTGSAAPVAAATERGSSSTIDARVVDGSVEIPVHPRRYGPIAAGLVVAGGVVWWALSSFSDPSSPDLVPPLGSGAAAGTSLSPSNRPFPDPSSAPTSATGSSPAVTPSHALPSASPALPPSVSGGPASAKPRPRPVTPPKPSPSVPPPPADDAIE